MFSFWRPDTAQQSAAAAATSDTTKASNKRNHDTADLADPRDNNATSPTSSHSSSEEYITRKALYPDDHTDIENLPDQAYHQQIFARDFPHRYFPKLSLTTGLSWQEIYKEQYASEFKGKLSLSERVIQLIELVKQDNLDGIQSADIRLEDIIEGPHYRWQHYKFLRSPLYVAQLNNQQPILSHFYESAKLTLPSDCSPVEWAIACRQSVDHIELLMNNLKVDYDSNKLHYLRLAAQSGHIEFVLHLLKVKVKVGYAKPREYQIVVNSVLGQDALSIAAEFGHTELVKALSDHGANFLIPHRTPYIINSSPLDLACRSGNVSCFEYILAKHEVTQAEKNVLLETAIRYQSLAIAYRLLELDADANYKHIIEISVENNDCDAAQLLEEYDATLNAISCNAHQSNIATLVTAQHHPYLVESAHAIIAETQENQSWYGRLVRR